MQTICSTRCTPTAAVFPKLRHLKPSASAPYPAPPDRFVGRNYAIKEERFRGIETAGKNGMKASGLVMINEVLYLWARNAIPGTGTGSVLGWSENRGVDWHWCDWMFEDIHYPVWMNAGKNYSSAADDFCYMYSTDGGDSYNVSDGIILARVSTRSITSKESYEFLAGTDSEGAPDWSKNRSNAARVITLERRCLRPDVVYHPPSGRYLLCTATPGPTDWSDAQEHYLGIFDAPAPWGPWTSVYEESGWGGRENRFQPRIPSKWIRDDGTAFELLYSCHPSGSYQFNIQTCTMTSHPD